METMIMVASLFAFSGVMGFVAGYCFRGAIHKQIDNGHVVYQRLHDAAVADFKSIADAIKARV